MRLKNSKRFECSMINAKNIQNTYSYFKTHGNTSLTHNTVFQHTDVNLYWVGNGISLL